MTSSKLSVQLYTVRELLADDLPGTIQRIADIGFTQVEPFAFVSYGAALGDALSAAGLVAPTTHQSFVGGNLDDVFSAAQTIGIGTVIDPHIADERWLTADSVRSVAADLNAAAKVANGYGITVGYHNHWTELQGEVDGTTPLELLAANLDDDVVLELDTYWAAVAGVDPIGLLGRLGDRVVALHIKDGPATMEPLDQVALGQGSIPIRAIIEAAPTALRVIELDNSRGDRFTAVADSFAYLTSEGLA